jgi:competence protein ComEC
VIGGLSLFAGVLAGLAMARTPTPAWMAAAAVSLLVASVAALRGNVAIRALAAFTLGALLVSLTIGRWSARVVAPTSPDMRLLLDARILDTPARAGTDVRFDAEVRVISGPCDGRSRRARLAWRDASPVPRAGERWRLLIRVASLTDTRNFAGADLARILLRDRIHLAGRVLPGALNERVALAPASIDTTRARIASRIRESVADPDAAALLAALAVGQTDGLSRDQWRVFNATGTTHLVAISGMHVTLFALLAFAVARAAWRWLPRAQRVDRETFAALAGLAAAGAYALLAGLSVPTQRTWLMLAIFVGTRLAARAAAPARVWSLALAAVLLADPLAPLAAGFWLSFVAVGVLLVVGQSALSRAPRPLLARVRMALSLQIAVMSLLAPLTVAVFGGISLAGLAVNLVAIPVISFVFVPLTLLGAVVSLVAPGLAACCFRGAAFLYEHLWPALVAAADVDLALWRVSPPAWWYAVAAIGAALALWRFPAALRATSLIAVLPLISAPQRLPPAGSARIEVLDAGRGASILIETRSRVLLYDTGDSWGSAGARARQIVLPALDALGRAADELVLPTLDPDRAAGAALLAIERGVGTIRVGGGWPGSDLPMRNCRDSTFETDGVRFELFSGGAGFEYCALRVTAGGHSLLIGGDLDAAAERALVASVVARSLRSEAVILSRHASALGSARQWIEASGPAYAIATGGIDSGSRASALERWRHAGARILDTHTDGALVLSLGGNGLEIKARASRSLYPFAWRRLP